MQDVGRKAERKVLGRQLDEIPQHEIGHENAGVVSHSKCKEHGIVAYRQRFVGLNMRRSCAGGRRRQELVNKKKTVQFVVLTSPHSVSGYDRDQHAHGCKKNVVRCHSHGHREPTEARDDWNHCGGDTYDDHVQQ